MAKITINDFSKKAYKKYIEAGMTPAGAAGLMGNQYAESAGFIAKTVEFLCLKRLKENGKEYTQDTYYKAVDSGKISKAEFLNPLPGKKYGFGLVQWTTVERKRGLYERTVEKGKSIADEDIQLDYVIYELKNMFPKTFQVLKTTKSVKEASDYVLIHYEAPADTGTTMKNTRADYGQQYYDYFIENNKGDDNMTVNEYIQKVIDIAKAEIGYLEKKSNKDLDDKTKNAGSNNYTKYGRDMHDIYPAVMDFPAAWCDCFVDWCFYKAYGISTAKSMLFGNFDDYTVSSAQMFKNKGAWYTSNPKVGDQIFFTNASGGICHTGLVVGVTSTNVITIEGNTSSASGVVANGGCVREKTYSLNYSRIAGYGRPPYAKFCESGVINKNTSSSTATSSTTSTSKKLNTTKLWKGKSTSVLNVRTWAGVEYSTCSFSPLKKGAKFNVLDEIKAADGSTWYYIKKNGKTGFVSGKYVKKVSENSNENSDKSFKPYECRTTASSLNIRSGAGTEYKIIGSFAKNSTCVIEQELNGFGKLQSRDGWISLKYIKKV